MYTDQLRKLGVTNDSREHSTRFKNRLLAQFRVYNLQFTSAHTILVWGISKLTSDVTLSKPNRSRLTFYIVVLCDVNCNNFVVVLTAHFVSRILWPSFRKFFQMSHSEAKYVRVNNVVRTGIQKVI